MRGDLGKEAAVFHGQGGHRDTLKKEVVAYFRAIDNAIRPIVRESHLPVILAGVDYELALFRSITRYDNVWRDGIVGAFDFLDDRQLFEAALPLAHSLSDEPTRRAVARYMEKADTRLASDDLEEIMIAAHDGRLDLLLVKSNRNVIGRFNVVTKTIEHVEEPDISSDLAELAIEQCVLHGGEAYIVDEKLTSQSPMHGLVRYW
jgi:hypothetical protein